MGTGSKCYEAINNMGWRDEVWSWEVVPVAMAWRQLVACSFSGSLACPWALTLVNVIAAEVGPIRVVGQEVSQEGGEVVAVPQHQVGAQHVLVHEAQVEVIAERMHVHQVPHLVTLLREQHGQLGGGLH